MKVARAAVSVLLPLYVAFAAGAVEAAEKASDQDLRRAADAAQTQSDLVWAEGGPAALERLSSDCHAALGSKPAQHRVAYCIAIDVEGFKIPNSAFFNERATEERIEPALERAVPLPDHAFMEGVDKAMAQSHKMISDARRHQDNVFRSFDPLFQRAADAAETQVKFLMIDDGLVSVKAAISSCYASFDRRPSAQRAAYCMALDVASDTWAAAIAPRPPFFARKARIKRMNRALSRVVAAKDRTTFLRKLDMAQDFTVKILIMANDY